MNHEIVAIWMTPKPITIKPEQTIFDAYRFMKKHKIRRLPVLDQNKLVGIITISDIRKFTPMGELPVLEHHQHLAHMLVADAMTSEPITTAPNESVGEVARLLMIHKFGGLPVLEEDKLVGVISESDIFRLLIAKSWQPKTSSSTTPDGEEHIVLHNGEQILIRPIRPDDATQLQHSFIQMSPETIYDRFLGYKNRLPDTEARYLSSLDYEHHMALIAITKAELKEEGIIAVARYHILEHQPDCAEFAVVVSDQYQRRGLGTLLMKRLMDYAYQHGIRTFLGITHAQNYRLLRLVSRSTLATKHYAQNDLIEVYITLGENPFPFVEQSTVP